MDFNRIASDVARQITAADYPASAPEESVPEEFKESRADWESTLVATGFEFDTRYRVFLFDGHGPQGPFNISVSTIKPPTRSAIGKNRFFYEIKVTVTGGHGAGGLLEDSRLFKCKTFSKLPDIKARAMRYIEGWQARDTGA